MCDAHGAVDGVLPETAAPSLFEKEAAISVPARIAEPKGNGNGLTSGLFPFFVFFRIPLRLRTGNRTPIESINMKEIKNVEAVGRGGRCLGCKTCIGPNCGFGKGVN